MGMLDRLGQIFNTSSDRISTLETGLAQERLQNDYLQESLADLELALQDLGWTALTTGQQMEFTPAGRQSLVDVCRAMAVSNPLVKRGVGLRIGYIWGKGVEISARDDDVNTLVQAFIEDNQQVLFGSQAHEENEKGLATDGELFFAFFTDPLDGRVKARSVEPFEITDILTNPEDRDEVWYYLRRYNQVTEQRVNADGSTYQQATQGKVVAYPALGYRPQQRRRSLGDGTTEGIEILWDAPMLHIPVNRLNGWLRGVPDVYAAVAWARAYKEFLGDWAMVTKSLAKFSWRFAGDTKTRAQKAAEKAAAAATRTTTGGLTLPNEATGQVAASGPGVSLEAIPKSGAHIDADSGRPLAAMVAAGLGVPVTMLLTDPGVTGARATAETLDQPTILETGMRRMLWSMVFDQILQYVIDAAIIAPQGPLQGTRVRDGRTRQRVQLADEQDRTVEVVWPDITDTPVDLAVAAIVDAASLGLIPDVEVVKLLLHALGVRDVDELVEANTDADGNWIAKSTTAKTNAGQAAIDAARRGQDPAEAFR